MLVVDECRTTTLCSIFVPTVLWCAHIGKLKCPNGVVRVPSPSRHGGFVTRLRTATFLTIIRMTASLSSRMQSLAGYEFKNVAWNVVHRITREIINKMTEGMTFATWVRKVSPQHRDVKMFPVHNPMIAMLLNLPFSRLRPGNCC